ncbi:phosphodiester glycosidase family protein [Streptomyces sp. NBC_01799]|uniref:phosphodiester glycosidase family protein n=1 Tax=Streptomyces sp. NBC_01800 TaxID=2975945 RepID=UPI002DD9F0E0|nr:phosphodiester glycosidase family protein [Streptomyces sp. NBC_01800]WSA71182.1 phosphodiester glycosidase family protein [Streptomyces sp. NBC_01800]WSA79690.1 phosphodiester glycosidase family protein [Streptomyces sp. NBC_01799]
MVTTASACTSRAPSPHDGAPRPAASAEACGRTWPCGVEAERITRRLADGKRVSISTLTVRPSARVTVRPVVGDHLATTETVGRMAQRTRAVAAVNGSFFDIAESPAFSGYPGDPLGVLVVDGELLSEAANGRTALILPGQAGPVRIDEVRSGTRLSAPDGATRELDGVDRVPGRIVGCGGVGGDRLAATGLSEQRPRHNQLCLDDSEIIAFTPVWGVHSPPGAPGSVEVVLDGSGRVTQVRSPAGGEIPRTGSTLVGMGQGADWLRLHARPGEPVARRTSVTDSAGRNILATGVSVLGAGPALLRGGEVRINDVVNGFTADTSTERQPRTVAGIKEDGSLLLAVFDGRTSASAGVTLREVAMLLRELGAVDAMNLDGGGSSTMVVRDRLFNRPSDVGRSGTPLPRKVSDALAVIPRN